MSKWFVVFTVGLLSPACLRASLHETYGGDYKAVFKAQMAPRESRDAPMQGEEGSRVLNTYYGGLGDSPGEEGGGGKSAASRPSGNNPPPFQIKAH